MEREGSLSNRKVTLDSCREFLTKKTENLKNKDVAPSKRYGHKSTLLGKYVVHLGGYSNSSLHLYDMAEHSWQRIQLTNESKFPGSVDILFLYSDVVYGCGFDRVLLECRVMSLDMVLLDEIEKVQTKNKSPRGEGTAGAFVESRRELILLTHANATSCVHVLNMDTSRWYEAKTKGEKPPQMKSHACCSYGNVLYFAGGCIEGRVNPAPLYVLTVQNELFEWSTPRQTHDYVPYRLGFRLHLTLTCSSRERVFTFGGYGQGDKWHMFSFKEGRWYELSNNSKGKEHCLPLRGNTAGGPKKHSAVQTKDGILVFGGNTQNYRFNTPYQLLPVR